MDYKSFTDKVSKTGKIYYGQAGCGKSWHICQSIYENRDKCIVFSHTNKAVVNIKNILKDKYELSPIEVNKLCHSFESYFFDSTRGIDDLKGKIVFVDEYSMTLNRYITLLYQAFTKHDITIIMNNKNGYQRDVHKFISNKKV